MKAKINGNSIGRLRHIYREFTLGTYNKMEACALLVSGEMFCHWYLDDYEIIGYS